ncbi:transglutaminase family protein [Luteimonas pelagia]
MRLHIHHRTTYRYAHAASLVVQALRVWPAPCPSQDADDWRVEVDGRLLRPTSVDGFGNRVATHTVDRKVETVDVTVDARVDTRDLHGVFGADRALPPAFYRHGTDLTAPSGAMTALAREVAGDHRDGLAAAHRLSAAVRDSVDYIPDATDALTPAAEAFEARKGVCQDHAHVLSAMARAVGFPARYVSGYLCPAGTEAAASHAWCELWIESLGWVGFDAANRQSPDARYVRIACGRDYRDAAPIRGVRQGGLAEALDVEVRIGDRGARDHQQSRQSQA